MSKQDEWRAFNAAARESLAAIGDGDWTPQETLLLRAVERLDDAADRIDAAEDRITEASDERENIRADFNHASAERALWRNRAENNRWYRIARDVDRVVHEQSFDDEDGNGFVPIDPLLDALRSDSEGSNRILTTPKDQEASK